MNEQRHRNVRGRIFVWGLLRRLWWVKGFYEYWVIQCSFPLVVHSGKKLSCSVGVIGNYWCASAYFRIRPLSWIIRVEKISRGSKHPVKIQGVKNVGCFPLCQCDRSETSVNARGKIERHFPIKPSQPRGIALSHVLIPFPIFLHKWMQWTGLSK